MIGQPLTVSQALLGDQQSLLPQSPWDVALDPNAVATGPAPEPFTWGAGGSRLTPDELARQRQQADALTAGGMDYSPIASPWQGLSRVAQALLGSYEGKQLDKESAKNAEYSNSVAGILANGGGDRKAVLGTVLTDPRLSSLVPFAKLEYERAYPKPLAPHYFQDNAGNEWSVAEGGPPKLLHADNTPKFNFLPDGEGGGNWVQVPIVNPFAQGGGGQAFSASGAMPTAAPPQAAPNNIPGGSPLDGWPPAEAIRDLQRNPSSAAQFDEVFGAGMAAKIIGR